MPPDAVTVLLVSEQAEEIKLITKSLRSFYPGCRVEVVYSPEEAFEWASKQDWHIIILDESLFDTRLDDGLQEIRRRALRAALIVAASRQDSAAALKLMRQGTDYCFFKDTPAFLTELPIVAHEVLEKRDLRKLLALARDRYYRLIDNLADMAYELDAEGRFLYVSPAALSLLHYDPQELIGLHYSTIIPAEDIEAVERRFNERRSERRATRRFKLRLLGKDPAQPPLQVEVNATALYDQHRTFIGTLGIVRPVVQPHQLDAVQRLANFPTPLTNILTNMEQLLQMVHDLCAQVGLPSPRLSPASDAATETVPETRSSSSDRSESIESPHIEERRQSPRIDIHMEARARVNGTSWGGVALNISQGGIFLLLNGQVMANQDQTIRLGFGSDVGVLEIPGSVRHIRGQALAESQQHIATTGLAIRFSPIEEVKMKILHSLLEGLRTQSVSMTVTVLLLAPPANRLSEESPPSSLDPMGPPEIARSGIHERRQASRHMISAPVQAELPSGTISSSLLNLSTSGACICLQSVADLLGRRLVVRFSSASVFSVDQISVKEKEFRFNSVVVWVASDNDPSVSPLAHSTSLRIGVRFQHDAEGENSLADLLRRHASIHHGRHTEGPAVSSEFLQCFNDHGQRLAICYDHRGSDVPEDTPLVILVPGYGQTKKDYIDLSYHFACNGFQVLRYDHSYHVGESDGGMVQTTLTGIDKDLSTMIEYAVHRWPTSPLVIVACDVAARISLKHAAQHPSVTLLMLFAPVFDLQYTLMTAHEQDLIGASLGGKRLGIANILGFNIDTDVWLTDAIQGQYADFQSTREDLLDIRAPMIVYTSELDPWTRPNLLSQVQLALGDNQLEWHESTAAWHTLGDREQTQGIFRQMVADGRTRFYSRADLVPPSERDVTRQLHIERERARHHSQMDKSTAVRFWRDYLDRSHSLVNFSEYWHLLDHIHRLLGPLDHTTRILDVGCGNGNFGMYLLIAASFQPDRMVAGNDRLNYLGLDLVSNGLTQAKTNLVRVAAELRGKFAPVARQSIVKAGLMCVDLNAPLPFRDEQFDRLVCNLVLGYLRDPLFSLKELVRILSPHGKLVVTTFKPQADLSQIYRKFLSTAQTDHERKQAKETVEAAGTITHASHTAFQFFNREELARILMESGASQPRIYSTFANQAYIAVAEKTPN